MERQSYTINKHKLKTKVRLSKTTNQRNDIKHFILRNPHLSKNQLIRAARRGDGWTAKLPPFFTSKSNAERQIMGALENVFGRSGDMRVRMYDIATRAETPESFQRMLYQQMPASKEHLRTLLGGDTPLFQKGSAQTSIVTLEDVFFKAKIRDAAMGDKNEFVSKLQNLGVLMKDTNSAYVEARKAAVTKVIYNALSDISKNNRTIHTYIPNEEMAKVSTAIKTHGMQHDYKTITEKIHTDSGGPKAMTLEDLVKTALIKGLQKHGAKKLHIQLFEPLRSVQRMVQVNFDGELIELKRSRNKIQITKDGDMFKKAQTAVKETLSPYRAIKVTRRARAKLQRRPGVNPRKVAERMAQKRGRAKAKEGYLASLRPAIQAKERTKHNALSAQYKQYNNSKSKGMFKKTQTAVKETLSPYRAKRFLSNARYTIDRSLNSAAETASRTMIGGIRVIDAKRRARATRQRRPGVNPMKVAERMAQKRGRAKAKEGHLASLPPAIQAKERTKHKALSAQYKQYNNSKSKGMIFFKLKLKDDREGKARYDYWYVKIEKSCAALSTVADLFDYEQVVHAFGAFNKIGLGKGKIPTAFRRSEKTSRDTTLNLIAVSNSSGTYGLVGSQVNNYDIDVDRVLKNGKKGSEIVVPPDDVPDTEKKLRTKLQDIRQKLQLSHPGVFILPVEPGSSKDKMLMSLHAKALGRYSSHKKQFPGAGEARIMCLDKSGGFAAPDMAGRKLIPKASSVRRARMIKQLKASSSVTEAASVLNNRARERVAERIIAGRGPLGILPSQQQVSGLTRGIGIVWWPILLTCITGIVSGILTALGFERSSMSLSWWPLGVSAALHLGFSGDAGLTRERSGNPERVDLYKVVQRKARSRFMFTMGSMCVFLGALQGGHGPISRPVRIAGIVLAVVSAVCLVLFLREGLSVPKFKLSFTYDEKGYALRVRKGRESKAETRLQAAGRGVAARRAREKEVAAATRLQAAGRGRAARRARKEEVTSKEERIAFLKAGIADKDKQIANLEHRLGRQNGGSRASSDANDALREEAVHAGFTVAGDKLMLNGKIVEINARRVVTSISPNRGAAAWHGTKNKAFKSIKLSVDQQSVDKIKRAFGSY